MKKRYLTYAMLLIIMIIQGKCIDPYDAEVDPGEPRVVVTGRITNYEESYFVTLTYSGNYSRDLDGISTFISGAFVTIKDDEGGCVELHERESGRYYSNAGEFKGKIGNSYYVDILLSNGKNIRSTSEVLLSPQEIADIYYEFNPGSELEERGFYVYIDTNDPDDQKNFYKWETVSWWLYSMDPCWNKVPDFQPFNLLDDKQINGNPIKKRLMKVVPYTSRSPYVVTVQQFALHEEAFEFLENINDQINLSGSIFDPPPTFIRGNLYNVDDPHEIILGYFYAGGVSTIEVPIDRTEPEESPRGGLGVKPAPLYCGDPCDQICATLGGGICGDPPCPPDCNNLPNVTYKPPGSWPIEEDICDE